MCRLFLSNNLIRSIFLFCSLFERVDYALTLVHHKLKAYNGFCFHFLPSILGRRGEGEKLQEAFLIYIDFSTETSLLYENSIF